MCVIGILMALFERSKSGRGQVVDAAMVDGCAYLSSFLLSSRRIGLWSGMVRMHVVALLDSLIHQVCLFQVPEAPTCLIVVHHSTTRESLECLCGGKGIFSHLSYLAGPAQLTSVLH